MLTGETSKFGSPLDFGVSAMTTAVLVVAAARADPWMIVSVRCTGGLETAGG